jgi:hypothetical protein
MEQNVERASGLDRQPPSRGRAFARLELYQQPCGQSTTGVRPTLIYMRRSNELSVLFRNLRGAYYRELRGDFGIQAWQDGRQFLMG